MPNVLMSGTRVFCLSWTGPALLPNALMSGTLVCYVSLGQNQPLCQVSLCLVHLLCLSWTEPDPYAKWKKKKKAEKPKKKEPDEEELKK